MSYFYDFKKGWQMRIDEDQSKDQFFIVTPFNKEICGITTDKEDFRWSEPHVLVPTRGLHYKNAKINNDGKNIWVDPIDQLKVDHVLPEVCDCIIGKPPKHNHHHNEVEHAKKSIRVHIPDFKLQYGIWLYYGTLAILAGLAVYFFRFAVK